MDPSINNMLSGQKRELIHVYHNPTPDDQRSDHDPLIARTVDDIYITLNHDGAYTTAEAFLKIVGVERVVKTLLPPDVASIIISTEYSDEFPSDADKTDIRSRIMYTTVSPMGVIYPEYMWYYNQDDEGYSIKALPGSICFIETVENVETGDRYRYTLSSASDNVIEDNSFIIHDDINALNDIRITIGGRY